MGQIEIGALGKKRHREVVYAPDPAGAEGDLAWSRTHIGDKISQGLIGNSEFTVSASALVPTLLIATKSLIGS